MPLSTPGNLQQFQQIMDPWKTAYRFADFTCVAIKTGAQSSILTGRVILQFAPPEHSKSFHLVTEHLIAHRSVIPIQESQIDTLIESATHGRLVVEENAFSLNKDGETLGSTLYPFHHPAVPPGVRIITLRIVGSLKESLLRAVSFRPVDDLDWELRAAEQPFESLDELLLSLGHPTLSKMSDDTAIEVVAFSPASILDTSHIKDAHAVVQCRLAKGLDTRRIRLGYKIPRLSMSERAFKTGSMFEWTDNEHFQDGVVRIEMMDGLVLRAFLSYQGTSLHQWWVLDPEKRLNRRQAVYEIFDRDLIQLKALINGEGKDKSRDFERGISFLAHLLGFDIMPLNVVPQLSEGPDLIISTPSDHIAVVECTVLHLDQDNKLAKLIQRTTRVRDKLNSTGFGHLKVQPVIMSLLTKAQLQVELEEAGKFGVAVLAKEDLETLINNTLIYPKADDLFERLSQYIPRPAKEDRQEALFTAQDN